MNNLSLLTFLRKRLACLPSQQIWKIGYLKFLVAALVLSSGYEQANAQGVGINTTTPHPSAALDIQSTNKGLLIPQVELQSSIDNATVPSPATGLLVYNRNGNVLSGAGYYQNTGTTASPNWEILSRLKLPYSQGVSTTTAFNIQNFQGSSGTIAIKGYSSGVGTGIFAESDNGYALQVKGFMKIFGTGQVPGAGKILTSDASGEASWQGPIAFSASEVKGEGGQVVPSQQTYRIPFAAEDYDLSNSYTLYNESPASTFTVPIEGLYHFDVFISPQDAGDYQLRLMLFRNGSETIISDDEASGSDNEVLISRDLRLLKGDQLFVDIFYFGQGYLDLFTQNRSAYFNAHLIK
ncbi:hypothetical protein [Dyadobacter sp.]|uniref:hypothetical protein n=1 Tax=Dyadobacter sp. TaxID=1914288 RepID=UPI003F6E5647